MGKRWRKYAVGKYRLGELKGQAVAIWRDETGHHRRRLGHASTEVEGRALFDAWIRRINLLEGESGLTVGEIYKAYQADRIRDGKVARNFHDSWRALEPRFGNLLVDAITDDICRDHARDRIDSGVSAGTVWTELTRLRSALNWALSRRMITTAPYVWLPLKPPPKQRVLTVDEAAALLDACRTPHVRLFVILALTTGARSQAITDLTWDRVDFDAATIDFRVPIVEDPLTKVARKNRAVVPMTAMARAALQDAHQGALSDHVIEWNGEKVRTAYRAVMAAIKRTGLKGVSPHTFRHTAASWSVSGGIDMELTAKLLGHRDPATTRRVYAKMDPDALRPAADVIDMKIRRKG